ncbi:MAG TPA: ATP-binding protein [Ignavibacteriales bacterium]|nr:ATP-binding protein [Ignavibacteriales bacterium]
MANESIRLLVIEDNPGDAALIGEMIGDISEIRVEMMHVTRLAAGLEALEKYGMDAVLLDLGLPDSYGINTLHKFQEQSGHVPIVVMTGLNDKLVAVQAIKAGAQDYLVKGRIDSELLEHSLRYAIERKRIEEALIESQAELRRSKEELEKNAAKLDALNKNLEEANASKDKFFSIVAHDLRSPFSALLGFTEYLSQNIDELDKEEIKDFAYRVHASLKRIFRLVDNLLQWSTLQSGRMEFSPVNFCLNILIKEVLDIYQVNAARKRINLNFEFDSDYDVYADKNMTDTVLRNLLSNALKFTYPDGRVTISLHNDTDNVVVAVSDTGTGISEEDKAKLFRIEENVSKAGTDKEKGTGLGLILVKDFVERNGGRIWVESQPGKGSTFKFTLKKKAR